MAIAPSKLGRVVSECMYSGGDALVHRLRQEALVRSDVDDDDLKAVLATALNEHAAIPEEERAFNSPNERVRVFLAPYLSAKGKQWAVPLDSLRLPDDASKPVGLRLRWAWLRRLWSAGPDDS